MLFLHFLGVRGGHSNLSSFCFVLVFSLLFFNKSCRSPKSALSYIVAVHSPLLIWGNMFSWPGATQVCASHAERPRQTLTPVRRSWGLGRVSPTAGAAALQPFHLRGQRAEGRGGPVSSTGTVLGAHIDLSACFMSVFLSTWKCSPWDRSGASW